MHDLLKIVREYYEATASDGGISLLTVTGNGPITAEWDRALMLRALSNLVSNAITHTLSEGSVLWRPMRPRWRY